MGIRFDICDWMLWATQEKVIELAKKYGQGAIYHFYPAAAAATPAGKRKRDDKPVGTAQAAGAAPFLRATIPALLPDTEADVPCVPCERPGIERADPEWAPL